MNVFQIIYVSSPQPCRRSRTISEEVIMQMNCTQGKDLQNHFHAIYKYGNILVGIAVEIGVETAVETAV